MKKKYVQYGVISIVAFTPLIMIFIYKLYHYYIESQIKTIDFPAMDLILLLIFLFCFLSFYKMTIELNSTAIKFKLGIGIIQKSYNYNSLKGSRAVRNSLLSGIGVRYLGNGWLYNVHGLSAVELIFKNKSNPVRLGTNLANEISEEVNKRIY